MRVLILGSTGMLGRAIFHAFIKKTEYQIIGTSRDGIVSKNIFNFDAEKEQIDYLISNTKPDLIINCIGIIKQIKDKVKGDQMITLNSIFPNNLHKACAEKNIRLIHFSTDCIFSGSRGAYVDSDMCDAQDLYGKSKYLGEVAGHNTLTLRTSIIGHEKNSNLSLVDWFLSQKNEVKGYKNAIFSGFTTNELANIIIEKILPLKISGIRNISAHPISKYELLNLIKNVYEKDITITACNKVKIDRTLISDEFLKEIGYQRKNWDLMVYEMKKFYIEHYV